MRRALHTLLGALPVFGLRAHTTPGTGRQAAPLIPIVALGLTERDIRLLLDISGQHGWEIHLADTRGEAWTLLNHLKAPIIMCDRDLEGEEWRDVVRMMASSAHDACAILLSRVVDAYLRNEVIANGGYDVVCKPIREGDLVRTVRLAWSYWKSSSRMPLPDLRR